MQPISTIARCFISVVLLAAASNAQQTATASKNENANIDAYIDLLRKDIKEDKVSIITELMDLDPEQASKFWPVYREYDKELTKLGDERIAFIRMYSENYGSLTDAKTTEIANGLLDLDGRRSLLKKKYFQKISQVLNPKLAAKFIQVEHQILLILDLQIASSLPLVE